MKNIQQVFLFSLSSFILSGCSAMTDTITITVKVGGGNFRLFEIDSYDINGNRMQKNFNVESLTSEKIAHVSELSCTYEVNQSKPHIFSTKAHMKAHIHCIRK